MSRALCRFGRFDLSRLPAAKRVSALSLQLRGWAPFNEFDGVVSWSEEGRANVWCWDRAALLAQWSGAGSGTAKLPQAVPESCLRGALADGVRLLGCLDGFEAQHWVGGQLLASRWWPARPGLADELAFQRDCGLPAEARHAELPFVPAAPAALAPRPSVPVQPLGAAAGWLSGGEVAVYAALAFALAVGGLHLAVSQWRLHEARAAAEAELARQMSRSEGAAASRNQALTSADHARALLELQPFPDPLVHMLAIARALPERNAAVIREWEQSDGRLRVLMASPVADIVGGDHVRAFEQTGLFSDVKILTQSEPRQMAFSMTLKPQAALALPPAGASAAAP